jgi:hypothetical protein
MTLQELIARERPRGAELRLSIVVSPALLDRVDRVACLSGISRAGAVRALLTDALDRADIAA